MQARVQQQVLTFAPDLPTCPLCIEEVMEAKDRRFGYIHNHCADCGPRFTTLTLSPFLRAQSSMARFLPCDACLEETRSPGNRRFAFEGISCGSCGPKTRLVGSDGIHLGQEALRKAVSLLQEGRVLALKGTGGFLLAVDARKEEAVALLRERKRRPHKAFAIMVRDLSWAREVGKLSPEDEEELSGPERPILLLPRQEDSVAPSVAPGLGDLGLFLPSSALQHLLLQQGPPVQVMTSANLSGAPIAKEDQEGLEMLGLLADGVLLHEREIHTHADDSVFRSLGTGKHSIPIRRSRGFVPKRLPLPAAGPPILALGGQEKSTLCLAFEGEALLSPHLGELDQPKAWLRFLEAVEKLQRWVGQEAVALAHDLHPDYRSSHWARDTGLPCLPVQHHHAHVAACLAELQIDGPVLGVAFDGTGYGLDGDLWGGEFLLADTRSFTRLGHLRPLALAGGSAAIRAPWRLGLAALLDAGEGLPEAPESSAAAKHAQERVAALLSAGVQLPHSSGAGRWFDAAGALIGLRQTVSYEGQAAAELEALVPAGPADPYPFELHTVAGILEVDLRPAIRTLAKDRREQLPAPRMAARFHETMARAVQRVAAQLAKEHGLRRVALVGGCFQNRVLTLRSLELLSQEGLEVLLPREVPQNDGGLSYGQAAVASQLFPGGL